MDFVLAGVPAPDRQVETAGKRQRAVDDDDFLMLRRAQGKTGIEAETEPVRCVQGEFGGGIPLPLRRVQRRKIPAQDVDAQVGPLSQQRLEKRPELFGIAVLRMAGRPDKAGLAVDVPTDDVDLPRRAQQRFPQSGEIRGRVVENCQPPCLAPSPDGLTRDEDG
ncbi:hypothetical protein [Bradyrhizobium jicamae]|uniref:hypothetical protein n=1 Tax=Bradyrhizobium jicamae TaxID=280332 RepID=UPI001FDA09F4|nr:hypothetical protein [Bradyrhizobium jicamae]